MLQPLQQIGSSGFLTGLLLGSQKNNMGCPYFLDEVVLFVPDIWLEGVDEEC